MLSANEFLGTKTGVASVTTIERTSQQLVLRSGSTTLILDKDKGQATMERKLLWWTRKPIERPLSEVVQVTVDANVDRASGVEFCNTMLIMRNGAGWALQANDKNDATATAAAIRDFLGITKAE